MFADIHFIDFLRANPALAVFVTLALGFLVGKLRWRSFSLGTVTSVLLAGVVLCRTYWVGQQTAYAASAGGQSVQTLALPRARGDFYDLSLIHI